MVERGKHKCAALDRQIKGYAKDDAVLTGVETGTSSPIRIPRGADDQSINTRGLYPAGEGAAHARCIYSAAIDGIEVGLVGHVDSTLRVRRPRAR